jgi:predicted nucleotidyltransferase component of viral defense system
MLTTNQLRQIAARTAARDIGNVEIDVVLTYLLQLLYEKGLTAILAFKGGTMLRKMVFGARGRLSTDLDFTSQADISRDDLLVKILDALAQPYHGIAFRFDRDKDWYLTDDGCAAVPVCSHAENQNGLKIKLQVSTREQPVLPVKEASQLRQDYFNLLPFEPAAIPSLVLEEAIAEKIRAASQRSKVRDLYDLSELSVRPFRRDLTRSLAVLKLWNHGGPGLDFERIRERLKDGRGYDLGELRNLLRKDQVPDLDAMTKRVTDGFQFLANLTEFEKTLARDGSRRCRKEASELLRVIGESAGR